MLKNKYTVCFYFIPSQDWNLAGIKPRIYVF